MPIILSVSEVGNESLYMKPGLPRSLTLLHCGFTHFLGMLILSELWPSCSDPARLSLGLNPSLWWARSSSKLRVSLPTQGRRIYDSVVRGAIRRGSSG